MTDSERILIVEGIVAFALMVSIGFIIGIAL